MPDPEGNPEYQGLAEFRYQIRCFLRFSEQAARTAGLEPQQHQLLLAVKGLSPVKKATIGVLAERLQIQHHSAVELVDRLAGKKFIRRYRSRVDRRQVFIRLTAKGEDVLRDLSLYHQQELQSVGPTLVRVLNTLIANAGVTDAAQESATRPQESGEQPHAKKTGVK